MVEPAVFLDRDNTLIANLGDLGDAGSVRLIDGVAEALLELRRAGYRLVVVTNQGGVARGKFTEADVDAVHQRIAQLLDEELHEPELIERFYYCPYHPEGTVQEYRREHSWRKPNPGMILQASRDMDLDLEHSWVIGDQHRDIAAGRAAGCRTLLLCNGREQALKTSATEAATSLAEAVKVILRTGKSEPIPSVSVAVPRQAPVIEDMIEGSTTTVLEPPPAPPQMRSAPKPPSASQPLVLIDLPQEEPPSLETEPPLVAEPPVATETPPEPEVTFEPESLPAVEPPVDTEGSEASQPPPTLDSEPPQPQTSFETETPPSAEAPLADELPAPPEPLQTPEPPAPAVSTEEEPLDFNWEVPAPPSAPGSQSTDQALSDVRRAILELSDEVRSERVRRSDLTPAKMTAGITQLLAVLCAFFGLLQLGDPESFDAFVKWLLGSALLQLVTITLLLLDQRG